MNKPLPALLGAFHAAILSRDTAAIAGEIQPHPRLSSEQQMAIYTEGYRIRLTQAIRSDYPALLAYLGEAIFDMLALDYIEANPSQGFNLDRYPHPFASYVRTRTQDGFAADLATLEGAIAETFMAPESAALDATTLARVTPEAFAALTLVPRTASCLLHLHFPAEQSMARWRETAQIVRPGPEEEYLYLVRHENEVRRHLFTPAEYHVLMEIAQGKTVGDALDNVAERHPQWFESIAASLQSWFARWMQNGFFQAAQN